MPLMTEMKATCGYYIREATGVTSLLTLGKKRMKMLLETAKCATNYHISWRSVVKIFCQVVVIQQTRRTEETERSSDARQTFVAERKKF